MRAAHERVRDATRISAKTQKSYFDARVKDIAFTEGQLVWLAEAFASTAEKKAHTVMVWTISHCGV